MRTLPNPAPQAPDSVSMSKQKSRPDLDLIAGELARLRARENIRLAAATLADSMYAFPIAERPSYTRILDDLDRLSQELDDLKSETL